MPATGFVDRFRGRTVTPADCLTFFGKSSATFKNGAGNISNGGGAQFSAAGVSPGATGADNVLAVYSLPPSALDVAGRGISILAQGSFAANANHKRIKIIINPSSAVVGSTVGGGGVTVADTGDVTTSGGGWALQALMYKYGQPGDNTQLGLHQQAQSGGALGALLAPSLITANEAGAILIAVVGNATSTVTDIVHNALVIGAMN
jgi:hypothetical protein